MKMMFIGYMINFKRKYIDYSDYRSICVEYKLKEQETKSLSKYLHDLGIILHYEDDLTLKGIIILSPTLNLLISLYSLTISIFVSY